MRIDGKKIAAEILEDLRIKVQKLSVIPHLAIILVGNDPASKTYVRQKMLTAEKIGIKTLLFQYPHSVPTNDLLKRLNDLNLPDGKTGHLSQVHGIIVQQPLPTHINIKRITHAIDPKKDVDGFRPNSHFQMPIAMAVLKILEKVYTYIPRVKSQFTVWLRAKQIVIIGKGETGGKPIIQSLKKTGIEPIILDSKTKNPKALTQNADIIISAVGKPNIIKPEMIKKGVILVSIGLHKGTDGKLHGDYDEEKIKDIASFYTPSPGGVGPVNVAMLLKNLLTACENFSR